MVDWFTKKAPIRQKFKALLALHAALGALACVGAVLAASWSLGAGLTVAFAAMIGHIALVTVSSKLICDPYVETVVRMEGLAAGDLASPVAYTDHEDCVGRMTRAMSVFKENALRASSAEEVEATVTELGTGLMALAQGNLTLRLDRAFSQKYEPLRKSFNAMAERLDHLITTVCTSTQNVLSASGEIRTASADLSQRTEQQAMSLEDTARSMSQVTELVQETAGNADQVNHTISAAHREAAKGGAVVDRAMGAMSAIKASSDEIANIITMMDSIAFQTNLLALNAGVEAARAGDTGKGFAVVANEVRALAQRSAEAAKDIKDIITKSAGQVDAGVSLVGETGAVLNDIVGRVGSISTLIEDISGASVRQASRLVQVNTAITEMEYMTQQNAAMVEQSTAATRAMGGQVAQLAELLSGFQVSGGHTRAAPRALAAAA